MDEIITADSNLIPTQNILGLLDRVSGAFSVIGPAGMQISSSDVGHGIASAPFAVDSLYHAGSSYLSILNESTGVATNVDLLDFPAPALGAPFITAMDNDGFNNVTYVAVRNNTATKVALDLDPSPYENYVGVIDRVTGAISWLPIGPQLAPAGLDGLAVNQHYEECDLGGSNPVNDPPVPEGADCTEDCHIFESDCADGDDNDGDGRIDCLDSDCNNQACDDELACTTDDVCVSETCTGTAKPCIDENPCSVDGICNEPSGECDYSQLEDRPNFGDCEVDGLACTIGRCVDSEGPTCFEQNRALIHEEDNGCRDSDPCTADSCVETYSPYPCASSICIQKHEPVSSIAGFEEYSSEAQCVHESMVGAVCQPSGNSCLIGICTLTGSGTPSSPYDVECLNTQPYNCGQTTDAENEVCLESGCSTDN